MEAIIQFCVVTLIGQGLKCRPQIPQRDVVFYGNFGDFGVDAVIPFDIVTFGGEDWHHTLFNGVFDDLAHIFAIVIGGAVIEIGFEADDGNAGVMQTKFALDGILALLTCLGVSPQRRKYGGYIVSITHGQTGTRE